MAIEKTLVLIKPDGVQRRLVGEIICRFERAGLKIVALKMVWPTLAQAKRHYTMKGLVETAKRSIANQAARGVIINDTPEELAKKIAKKLFSFITAGPVVAMVLTGNKAIEMVRKLVGATEPLAALPGTIRGDWGIDSYEEADSHNRAIRNIVHASGNAQEAENEIKIWFTKKEINDYKLPVEETLYGAWG
jgi:nucleoside-diphosphate kinase